MFRSLLKQKIFCVEVKVLPVIQHGFLRIAENVYIHNFLMLFGKKFPLWQMLKPLYLLVELLLVLDGIPLTFYLKADVIAFIYIGRCYDQCLAVFFYTNVG